MSEREAFMAWAEDVRPACTYADHSYPAYTKAQMLDCWQAASAGKAELLEALKKARNQLDPECFTDENAAACLHRIVMLLKKHGGTP